MFKSRRLKKRGSLSKAAMTSPASPPPSPSFCSKSLKLSGQYGCLNQQQEESLHEFHCKLLNEQSSFTSSPSSSSSSQPSSASSVEDNDELKGEGEMKVGLPEDEEYQRELLRFLRARNFQVDKSLEMYQKTLEWRLEHNIETILTEPPAKLELAQRVIPGCHHKFDKLGRPIRIERMGDLLSSRIHELFDEKEYLHIHAWDTEKQLELMKVSRNEGKDIETVMYIGDMKNLTAQARRAVWLVRGISALDALHYPERCGKVFLINCPWVFPMLYNNLVAPFLDPVVRQKIFIFNDNGSEALLEHIDSESLPEEYGGSCQCADGCVPKYSVHHVHEALASLQPTDLKTQKIKGGQTFSLDFDIEEEGAIVDWFFKMDEKQEIGFSVFWDPSEGKREVVKAAETIVFDKFGEEGEFAVKEKGKLTLEWKSGAKFFKKVLKYSIQQNELSVIAKNSEDCEEDSSSASGSDCM